MIPHENDIERGVLGAVLSGLNEGKEYFYLLQPDRFYSLNHQEIFKTALNLYDNGNPITALSLDEKTNDHIDLSYLSDLTREPLLTNCEYYANILIDTAQKRKVIDGLVKLNQEAYNLETNTLIDRLSDIALLNERRINKNSFTPSEIFKRDENTPKAERFYTGISKLDFGIYAHAGTKRGQVELTIADSGHGKTVYTEMCAILHAKRGRKIHWFQLEDTDSETARHFEKSIPQHMDNILISDSIYDIELIKREAIAQHRIHNTDIIVIDYVQNIEYLKDSRSGQVEYVSQQLTRLAKRLNVKVHILSQVTINYSTRTGWQLEPRYGDVRWSQQLKQDAHIITSVFRPSRVESLVVGNQIKDWKGNLMPFDSVYVRQAKVRGGEQEYARLHLVHGDMGLEIIDESKVFENQH